MKDRPLLPSYKCWNAFEVWHEELSGECCDHVPLGPAERKGIHEQARRFFANRVATAKQARRH